VQNAFYLSVEEISQLLDECKRQCKHFEIHGQKYRSRHLNRRLVAAREKGDEEAERRILEIVQQEQERAFWRGLNWALGERRGSSVSAVQVTDEHGNMDELTTQAEVQEALWGEVHQGRYHLAEEAPISQGKLRGQYRYNATLLAARQVLEGGYKFGEDFGAATKRICEVIADIRRTVPEDSVDQIITRKIWQQKWKKKDENTASSVSTYTLDTTSQARTMTTSADGSSLQSPLL
jgi:hypothetical protein